MELTSKLDTLIRWDYFVATIAVAAGVFGFYLAFLGRLSNERHHIFRSQFRGLFTRGMLLLIVFGVHKALAVYRPFSEGEPVASLLTGLLAVILGATVVIKTFEIAAYEYFFLNSMRAGVPLLLINVCSLALSIFCGSWLLTFLFDIQLASVLTTSAVLTIVLGLALQDTLGNLFAAISLQIDKPFEMDDWVELKNGGEKIAGQVKEISWRATVLLAITDEYITLPNRLLSQWQILNFSGRNRPFYRSHLFRFPFDVSIADAKKALLQAADATVEVLTVPAPLVIITETTESWVTVKAVYAIRDYGAQFIVADKFHERALSELARFGIRLATERLTLENGKGCGQIGEGLR